MPNKGLLLALVLTLVSGWQYFRDGSRLATTMERPGTE